MFMYTQSQSQTPMETMVTLDRKIFPGLFCEINV